MASRNWTGISTSVRLTVRLWRISSSVYRVKYPRQRSSSPFARAGFTGDAFAASHTDVFRQTDAGLLTGRSRIVCSMTSLVSIA